VAPPLLSIALILGRTALADTLIFDASDSGYGLTDDTFIAASSPDDNFDDQEWVYIDASNGDYGSADTRALIRFPRAFGDADGQVGADATVRVASLILYVADSGDTVSLYTLLQDWDADEVTWSSRGGELGDWDAPGAEPPASDSALLSSFAGNTGFITIDITSAAQAWAADPATNHGVLLATTGGDGTDIPSSGYNDSSLWPVLMVTIENDSGTDTAEPADTGDGTPVTVVTDTGTSTGGASTGGTAETTGATASGPLQRPRGYLGAYEPPWPPPTAVDTCGCAQASPRGAALSAGVLLLALARRRPGA